MRDVRSAAGLLTQLPAGLSRTLGVVGKQFGVAMAFARSHAVHAAAGAGRWLSLPRSDSKSASDVSFSVAKAVGAGGALVGIALVVFVVTRPGEAPAEFAALETAAGGAISLHDGPTSRSSEQGQQSGERRPDVVLRDTIQASPIRQAQMDEGSMNVAQRGPGTDGAHQPMPQGVLSSAFITTRTIIDPPRDSRAAAQEPTEVGANSVTDARSARMAGAKTDRRDPTQSASVESGAAHRRTGEPAETLVSNKIIDGVSLSAILEETAPLAEQPLLEAAASNPAGVGEPGDAMVDGASWTTAVDTETPAQEAFTAIAASGEGTSPETPAPPAAVAADPDVSELITKANAAIAANRLLIPESKSAYRYLQQAAAILPDDPGVQRGFRRILARYAELATKAMRAGDYDKAERFTDRGLRVQPNDRATRSLQDEIRAARAEEEARRARQAAAISPPEPPVDRKTEPTGFDLMMQILDGS